MINIHLQNLKFFCYHGYHEGERIVGNEYEVDAMVQFHEPQEINHLDETINYTRLYGIIENRMQIPSKLLEPLAMDIGATMKKEFLQIQSISIKITKMHPPISGMQGSVAVSWDKEF